MVKLKIYIPLSLEFVSRYIIELILKRFWGFEVEIKLHEEDEYEIQNTENSLVLRLPAFFISREKEKWMQQRNPEDWGVRFMDFFGFKKFPVLFHGRIDNNDKIHIDFFGTLFFLFNRYHELVENLEKDQHNRVISEESFLARNHLLHLPLSDIYVDKLADLFEKFLGFKPASYSDYDVLPSHDVDRPFEYLYYKPRKLVKRVTGDILIRKSMRRAIKRIQMVREVKGGFLEKDPYNTFDWIRDVSDRNNRISTFHFISEATNNFYDQDYNIDEPEIKNLLRSINDANHLIALHPSYQSSDMKGQIESEFRSLKKVTSELNITQKIWKSRNHFLRWNKSCISELENAGIDIDQTMGFAEYPGFRCGTCRSFYPFNYDKKKISSVLFEPLILMEVSLFDKGYLGLRNNLPEAWNHVTKLKEVTRKYGGNFTVLWHNNHLVDKEMKEFYTQCIS